MKATELAPCTSEEPRIKEGLLQHQNPAQEVRFVLFSHFFLVFNDEKNNPYKWNDLRMAARHKTNTLIVRAVVVRMTSCSIRISRACSQSSWESHGRGKKGSKKKRMLPAHTQAGL
jgi:hypothetical protein